jgi:hypothetical protein
MVRWLVALLVCVAALDGAVAQVGYDRPGGDYTSFAPRGRDPAICAIRCDREGRCRAWSYTYPSADNPQGTCWLKNDVPQRKADGCCASGVRGAGVIEPKSTLEVSMDRYGGDYRNFETPPDPSGADCKAACEGEARCRVWTYVRPGYLGPQARCFLKERVRTPRRAPCCTSGVVR